MGGGVGEESRQSKGLVCGYCGVKGAGLANEFIDLPGKAKGGALLQGAIAEKPRFSPPPKGGEMELEGAIKPASWARWWQARDTLCWYGISRLLR